MKRLQWRWLLLLAVVVPVLTVAAQRRGRGSPGNNPNPNVDYDGQFTFVRVRFEPLGGSWDLKWDHDYPRAENHFMKILDEVTAVRPHMDGSNILSFDDPEIYKYPVAYVSEPGFWTMSPQELTNVRDYVNKGGFIIFDDFAGEHWYNFEAKWREAFPNLRLVKLDLANPIFDSFFRIESLEMAHPNYGGLTSEFYGAYEDNDPSKRLVMVANYNNDIGDYMEFSDEGYLPIALTNEAYKLAVNYVLYAMTH
ncbi:MAG: DUF4159 domain-containing protein [Gemmatimonadaceae bacterium]